MILPSLCRSRIVFIKSRLALADDGSDEFAFLWGKLLAEDVEANEDVRLNCDFPWEVRTPFPRRIRSACTTAIAMSSRAGTRRS